MKWSDPIAGAADAASRPAVVFFRDDDAGWNDVALGKLLRHFRQFEIPLDVAVIPQAMTSETRTLLTERFREAPDLLGIHQHGFAHADHARGGRRCEYGSDRNSEGVAKELRTGRRKLLGAFGPALDPFFTPPWNRCAPSHAALLPALGFDVLSRDATAPELGIEGLQELPIRVDWLKKRERKRVAPEFIAEWIAREIRERPCVGVMLHHAEMTPGDYGQLDELLTLLRDHPKLRGAPMRDCVDTNG